MGWRAEGGHNATQLGRAAVQMIFKLSLTEMLWKSVKALEQENRRLREEKETWVQKALNVSKRLFELERKTLSGLPHT